MQYVQKCQAKEKFWLVISHMTDRDMDNAFEEGKKRPKLKQASLFSLRGVVVIEELQRQKKQLKDKKLSPQRKEEILLQLAAKKPSTKLIIETGIGRTVKRLSKESEAAKKVYDLWRSEIEKRESLKERGPIDVSCDAETNAWRSKARRLIGDAGVTDVNVLTGLEKNLFDATGHLINTTYRRTVRRMVFACKHQEDLRQKLSSSSSARKEFVATSVSATQAAAASSSSMK